jgi:hypothetical protein
LPQQVTTRKQRKESPENDERNSSALIGNLSECPSSPRSHDDSDSSDDTAELCLKLKRKTEVRAGWQGNYAATKQ